MCGLVGIYDPDQSLTRDELESRVRAMRDTVAHRGPDDEGEWVDATAGVAFGFRRLSVVDLSAAGHQPMLSASGRFVMMFNGEVYNAERLRAELMSKGVAPSFRGHSDTEVMLASIEAWGLAAATSRFIGMFAIALWDRSERTLHLIRDRAGVKPLHYGWVEGALVYASELKALASYPRFEGTVEPNAVACYAEFGYIPAPLTIYAGVRKLAPGTIATFRGGGREPEIESYWSAEEAFQNAVAHPFRGSEEDAEEALLELVRDSVKLRMIADVPVGVFLSGGIDSALVTAVAQAAASGPVKTFTIGMPSPEFDEAPHAKAVAKWLRTEHTEVYITPEDVFWALDRLSAVYDEPLADTSLIPTYLVSQTARRVVTVSLSGDGGDELFGGYHRYWLGRREWVRARKVPKVIRPWASNVAGTLARMRREGKSAARLQRFGQRLADFRPDAIYRDAVRLRGVPLAHDLPRPLLPISRSTRPTESTDPATWMMYLDFLAYLPDDILAKVDRASMAVSLEAREPLLDHRIIEFAWSLPLEMKIEESSGKRLLRKLLGRFLPPDLALRRKLGFGLPLGNWLRGPLREWAESLLEERGLAESPWVDGSEVRRQWYQHLAGSNRYEQSLWTVLMFQMWSAAAKRTATVSAR